MVKTILIFEYMEIEPVGQAFRLRVKLRPMPLTEEAARSVWRTPKWLVAESGFTLDTKYLKMTYGRRLRLSEWDEY